MIELELQRRKRGLNQTELGNQIVYSTSTISWLEKSCPGPDAVNRRLRKMLQDYFEMPLEQLLKRVE